MSGISHNAIDCLSICSLTDFASRQNLAHQALELLMLAAMMTLLVQAPISV